MISGGDYTKIEAMQNTAIRILEGEKVINREVRYHILSASVALERALIIADKEAEEEARTESPILSSER